MKFDMCGNHLFKLKAWKKDADGDSRSKMT